MLRRVCNFIRSKCHEFLADCLIFYTLIALPLLNTTMHVHSYFFINKNKSIRNHFYGSAICHSNGKVEAVGQTSQSRLER
jgi:hypothetical protein